MVENEHFIEMVRFLKSRATVPHKRLFLEKLRGMKKGLDQEVLGRLTGEHVAVTSDGWTSASNDTYMYFTCTYISSNFDLVALCVECKKHGGRTTGEDLVEAVKAMIARNGLTSRTVATTTDCEPSMVKAGRLLEENEGVTHLGCFCHRLESITSQAFGGPGVSKALALARRVVTRYNMSSQASDRLEQMRDIVQVERKKVVQDVETRWWSTYASICRLLSLRRPITEHERIDSIPPLLKEKDWEVLQVVEPLSKPFILSQKHREASKDVTVSLVIPYIADLRDELDEAVERLQAHACPAESIVAEAKKDVFFAPKHVRPTSVIVEPRGFKKKQVLATALDPRSKSLYGIEETEHSDVWEAVANEAVKVAIEAKATEDTQSAGASSSLIPVEPAAAAAPQPRRRRDFAAASAVPGDKQQSANASSSTSRVLCIPASQPQSERVFSSAGLVVTKTRARMDPENVELMLFLRNVLREVDRWNGNGNKRKSDPKK
ncbi:unnamed protein product [Ectocarpus sp. CCAP 1310/34]|nr:unnamed protein product [Ectocarpus sp. CCAP 1310/34]